MFNKKVNIRLDNTYPASESYWISSRLHDITTNILPRSEQVSSEVQLYNRIFPCIFVHSPYISYDFTTIEAPPTYHSLYFAFTFVCTLINGHIRHNISGYLPWMETEPDSCYTLFSLEFYTPRKRRPYLVPFKVNPLRNNIMWE